MQEDISGIIERVTFHSEDTGFSVLRVKVKGNRDLITVIGSTAGATAGEYINARGIWVTDREHGKQFKADDLRTACPTTREGIEKYLGSGLIKEIGPHYASKLVDAFGEGVFDVIEKSPEQLLDIEGIGSGRKNIITSAWADQKIVREIMVFLQSHGVGTSKAFRIYKTYGDDAIDTVRNNPYQLSTDIFGIGFKTADQIAANLGIDKTSVIRAQAGVNYALQTLATEGHCTYPYEELVKKSAELLEIPDEIIKQAIDIELEEKRLFSETIDGGNYIYMAPLYHSECGLARSLKSLMQGINPLYGIEVDKAVEWVQQKVGLELADSQIEAVTEAVKQKVLVITGGPGVGKTTLVQSILQIYTAKKLSCLLCAPTGRAAKRLSETTNTEAKTIHRLLEFDPRKGGFKKNEDNKLQCDAVIVDEVSMVDVVLMYQLARAIPENAVLIMVGDVDQLPSVGPGNVLSDLINSDVIPVVRLTQIFRQAAESRIITNAHCINEGQMPVLKTEKDRRYDFYFMEADEPEDVVSALIKIVTERIPEKFSFDPVKDIQVITPMNRSGLGAHALNEELQKVLNPPHGEELRRFGSTFRVGDKVMQIENNYDKEVFNGDIGFIDSIDSIENTVTIMFDGREVEYDYGELDEIVIAYACTIHKSQGSEFPAVVMPIHTQHYIMLQRNLIYTGITRSRKLVVLIGTKKALSIAVKKAQSVERHSMLKERLMND